MKLDTTLRIRCRNVDPPPVVRARLHDCGLAVTERISKQGTVIACRYTVTHAASGWKIPYYGSVEDCWRAIEALSSIADWTLSAAQLKQIAGLELRVAQVLDREHQKAKLL